MWRQPCRARWKVTLLIAAVFEIRSLFLLPPCASFCSLNGFLLTSHVFPFFSMCSSGVPSVWWGDASTERRGSSLLSKSWMWPSSPPALVSAQRVRDHFSVIPLVTLCCLGLFLSIAGGKCFYLPCFVKYWKLMQRRGQMLALVCVCEFFLFVCFVSNKSSEHTCSSKHCPTFHSLGCSQPHQGDSQFSHSRLMLSLGFYRWSS